MNNEYELYHYGVLGMKWGVRRYQKKDGSLTNLGKRRIKEGASVFPRYKGKNIYFDDPRAKNRSAVIDKYQKDINEYREKVLRPKYNKYLKKHPEFSGDKNNPDEFDHWIATRLDRDTKLELEIDNYIRTLNFINEYAEATLVDLDMKVTKEGKNYAQSILQKRKTRLVV